MTQRPNYREGFQTALLTASNRFAQALDSERENRLRDAKEEREKKTFEQAMKMVPFQERQAAAQATGAETSAAAGKIALGEAERGQGLRQQLDEVQAIPTGIRNPDKEYEIMDRLAGKPVGFHRQAEGERQGKMGRDAEAHTSAMATDKAQRGLIGAQATKALADAGQVGKEGKPKLTNMTQGELDDLTLVETAASTLNDIRDAFGEISGAKKGPVLGRIAGANPYDVSVQKLNKLIDSITPALARGVFREVGVLTDKDMTRYKALLPQAKTDPKVAEEVFRDIQKKIQETYTISLRNMGRAGRDISAFDPETNLFQQKAVGDTAQGNLLDRDMISQRRKALSGDESGAPVFDFSKYKRGQ